MATEASQTSRPGVSVGPTTEFSLFFHVKPGHGRRFARRPPRPADPPWVPPGRLPLAIATIHEARFVLFDDDTRLLFATSFDGPWDAYMDDFFTSGPTLALFDAIFQHAEGYEGLPDLAAVQAFVLGAQQTAAAYARNYGGTVKEIRKARARQQGVPASAGRSGSRGRAGASCAETSTRRGRRLARRPGDDVRSHFGAAGAGRANRGHHRRLRVSEPRAPRPARPRDEHAALRAALRPILGRARLPLPAPPADAGRGERPGPVRGGEDEFVFDCVFAWSPTATPHNRGRARPRRVRRSRSASTTSAAARGMARMSSPGSAGTRSSWTLRRR